MIFGSWWERIEYSRSLWEVQILAKTKSQNIPRPILFPPPHTPLPSFTPVRLHAGQSAVRPSTR